MGATGTSGGSGSGAGPHRRGELWVEENAGEACWLSGGGGRRRRLEWASVLASGVVDPSGRGRKQGRGEEEAGVVPAESQEQRPAMIMTFAFCSEDDVVGAERVQDRGLGGGIWHCCLRHTSRTPAGPQEGPRGLGYTQELTSSPKSSSWEGGVGCVLCRQTCAQGTTVQSCSGVRAASSLEGCRQQQVTHDRLSGQ